MVKRLMRKEEASHERRKVRRKHITLETQPEYKSIPSHLDEDIDDDLAFNSDDEMLYGHFFKEKDDGGIDNHKGKKYNEYDDYDDNDNDNDNNNEDNNNNVAEYYGQNSKFINKHSKAKNICSGAISASNTKAKLSSQLAFEGNKFNKKENSNDVEFIDLSDMLDLSLEKEEKKDRERKQNRTKVKFENEKKLRPSKKRRLARITEATESLYNNINELKVNATKESSQISETFHTSLNNLLEECKVKTSNKDIETRLQKALYNNQNLIAADEDDITKTRVTRKEVRQVVSEDLEKYAPTLRELNNAKHIRMPLMTAEDNPLPSSLKGIVSANMAFSSNSENICDTVNNIINQTASPTSTIQKDKASSTKLINTNAEYSQKFFLPLQTSESAIRLTTRMNSLLYNAGMKSSYLPESVTGNKKENPAENTFNTSEFVLFDEIENNAINGREREQRNENASVFAHAEQSVTVPSASYMIKLKSMLASENSRRKRFNKIKSKTYRRILRKEKEHERERRRRVFELLHPEEARKRLAEKLSHSRAHERVTQKHKNTSMWVRHVKRFADKTGDTKDALNEQLHLHQTLMQKIEEEAGAELHTKGEHDGTTGKYKNSTFNDNEDNDDVDSVEEEKIVDNLICEALLNHPNNSDASVNTNNLKINYLEQETQINGDEREYVCGQHKHKLFKENMQEQEEEEQSLLLHHQLQQQQQQQQEEWEEEIEVNNSVNVQRENALDDLLQMKFMKVARERQQKEYDAQIQSLKDEVAEYCKRNGTTENVLQYIDKRCKEFGLSEHADRATYDSKKLNEIVNVEQSAEGCHNDKSDFIHNSVSQNNTMKESTLEENGINDVERKCNGWERDIFNDKSASTTHKASTNEESSTLIRNKAGDKRANAVSVYKHSVKPPPTANVRVMLHKQIGIVADANKPNRLTCNEDSKNYLFETSDKVNGKLSNNVKMNNEEIQKSKNEEEHTALSHDQYSTERINLKQNNGQVNDDDDDTTYIEHQNQFFCDVPNIISDNEQHIKNTIKCNLSDKSSKIEIMQNNIAANAAHSSEHKSAERKRKCVLHSIPAEQTESKFAAERLNNEKKELLPHSSSSPSYISLNAQMLSTAKKQAFGDEPATSQTQTTTDKVGIVKSNNINNNEHLIEDEMSEQEYIIARAFAHDDVDEDFVEQKVAQVNTIMKPDDPNANLPGWGEWGGINPALNKRHLEKRAHVAAQKEIERSFLIKSRADAKLSHVIINHDGVELVPDRMTLHMIPRPFSNPTEFARSLRQPTGPEWTSSLTFKEMVEPRVEVRKGHSVVPLNLSMRARASKTKRRKNTKGKL